VGYPTVQYVTVGSEGANQTVNGTCIDLAGNQASTSFGGIFIDKTPPQAGMTATAGGLPYTGAVTNQTVVVTLNCSDSGGSGIASGSGPQYFNGDGDTSAGGTCTDLAGNSTDATFSPIRVYKSLPIVTATVTAGGAPYVAGSWTNQVVVVTFQCTPAQGLSVSSLTQPVTLSDGANQVVSGTCVDQAGNAGKVQTGPINVDRTPPTLSIQNLPAPNANGWYNNSVTIVWLCSDNVAGQSTVTRTVTTEGANQAVSATCTDLAGNNASASQTVSIDKTPPVITGQVSLGVPASGWYRSPVNVSFTCSDSLSGVAPGFPTGNTALTSDTNGTTVNGTCRDLAGNIASFTTPTIRIDNTPPSLVLQSVVPQTAAGWSNGPATVTWACTDSGSGPVTPTVTQVVPTSSSVTGSCTDVAGNSATSTPVTVRIDTTPPFVNLISPANFTYQLNQVVFANYTCSDAASGIANCSAPLAPGQRVDTSVPGGPFTFTVTGVDKAGNQTLVTHTYFIAVAPGDE
jgi:hypothetical protein